MSALLARLANAGHEPADTAPLPLRSVQEEAEDDTSGFSDTLPLGWKHSANSTFFQASRLDHLPPTEGPPLAGARSVSHAAVLTLIAVIGVALFWALRRGH